MKDIELPPLPPACGAETLSVIGWGYTEDDMQAYARAAVEANSVPDGWKLVPVEPTEVMNEAGRAYFQATYLDSFTTKEHYRRMLQMTPSLATSPAPAQQEAEKLDLFRKGYELGLRQVDRPPQQERKPMTEEQTKCWCQTCRPITMSDMRMVLCPTCGNKRCPKANDHRNECTGSNEPGQPGSAY